MKNCGNILKNCASIFFHGCVVCVYMKKCASILKKLQIHSKTRKVIFLSNFFQFGSGSPDPFEVFGINPDELPDIPDEPPLPVIPPPKKKLPLKSISKRMVQGEQPSTSRAPMTVAKSGSSSPTRYVAIENVEHLNMFTLHVKAHCALCSLDQKSDLSKPYQIMQQKVGL